MLEKPSCVLIVVMVAYLAAGVAAQEKPDAQAREAAEQFHKALKAKDLEAVMKVVDAPFCREGGPVIAKRDELKQFFQKVLEGRDHSKDTIKITQVTTLPKLEAAEGKFTDDERKAAMTELGKDHRVVKVERNRFGEGKHTMLILVRFRDGKAAVVGII